MSRAAALLLLLCTSARAGDRQVETLFVNMTPDAASSEASKQCVRAVEKKLSAEYVHLVRLGETALRKLAGKTAGEPFTSWPAPSLKPARERGETWADVVVLVDCRPEEKRIEVLVNPASGGVVLLRLAEVPIERAATDLIAGAIWRRATAGFSP
jgi:hypothetical protein